MLTRIGGRFGLVRERDAGFYDDVYRTAPRYHTGYDQSVYLPVWQQLVNRIPPESKILEIGCGPGQLAELLYDRGIRQYLGLDISDVAVNAARERVPAFEFDVADARTDPRVQDRWYDVAVCTEVFEHVRDDLNLLERVRPGARVLATVPSFWTTGHLRWFKNSNAAAARYGKKLAHLEVVEARGAEPATHLFFLLDGVRPR